MARILCACLTCGLNVALFLAVLALLLINQPLRIPDILSDQVETRLADLDPKLDLEIGSVGVQLNNGWRPALRLRNVDITDAETGQIVATVEEIGAALAIRPLLRAQVQPRRIWLMGAVGQVRRGADGSAELSFGGSPALASAAFGPEMLMEQWERLFELPQMVALRDIDIRGVSIQYTDQARNWAATLDDGTITVQRDGDRIEATSSFAILAGGQGVSSTALSYTSHIGSPAAEFSIDIENVPARALAVQSPGLEWLSVLRAPISGQVSGRLRDDGSLAPALASLEIGSGVVQPTDAARPIPFDHAVAQLRYDVEQQVIHFDGLSVDSAVLSASASGVAQADLRSDRFALDRLTGQFAVTEIRIAAEELYDAPLFLQGLSSDFRVSLNPFRLTLAGTQISDGTSAIRISGDITSDETGWGVALRAAVDRIAASQVVALWPKTVIPKARAWVEERIATAMISDVDVAVRRVAGAKPDVVADFDFADASVRFLKTLPPLTQARGQGSFDNGRFVATLMEGGVDGDGHGRLDASGTSFIIPDTDIPVMTPSLTRLSLRGPVAAAMALLNRPPLEVLKDSTLPVDLAKGEVDVSGTIAVVMAPRVTPDMVSFHMAGDIRDVHSTVLVPGHDISARVLDLRASETGVEIAGAVSVSGVPATLRWSQVLGPEGDGRSQVTGQIPVSAKALQTFNVALPSDAVSGLGQASLRLDLGGGVPPRLTLRSDLQGVAMALPPLGWRKPAAQTGALDVQVTLGEDPQVDRVSLRAAGLDATAQVRLSDGALDRVEIAALRIGSWLEARGALIGRGPDRAPDVQVTGGRVDLRGFKPFPSRDRSPPGGLDLRLDRLVVADSLAISDLSGQFALAGGLSGPFTGRVNGIAPVTGTVAAQDGGEVDLRIASDDAGELLGAMRILRRVSGGELDMALTRDSAGHIEAETRINSSFVVRDAPALAAVLNTITVFGVVTELSGGGIWFSRAEARFGIDPDGFVSIYEALAEGPTVGLTLDGRVDTRSGRLDLQGVVSPFYALNALGGALSRRGEGLIGVTFRLVGPAEDPSVTANPLSALVPGGLRDIFRSNTRPRELPGQGGDLLPKPDKPPHDPFAPSPAEDR